MQEQRTSKKVQQNFTTISNISGSDDAQRELRLLQCVSSTSNKSSIWQVLHDRYSSNHDQNHSQNDNNDDVGQLHVEQSPTVSRESRLEAENHSVKFHIERITRGQRDNPLWQQYRQYRVPSSIARKLLHSTDVGRATMIRKIMNVEPKKENITPAVLYGIQNEAKARQRYSRLTEEKVEECGCFVDGILVASPDGYIPGLDRLLEIKGLSSQRNQHVAEAVQEKQSEKSYPYSFDSNGNLCLKQDNSRGYYEQVQMQMGLSGKHTVDLVVYSDIDLEYFPIKFDEAFFVDLYIYKV